MKIGFWAKSIAVILTLFGVATVEAVNYAAAARGVSKKIGPKVVSGVKSLYREWNSEEVKRWRNAHKDIWIPCTECVLGTAKCPGCGGNRRIFAYDMFGNLVRDMFGNPVWCWCSRCGGTGKIRCPNPECDGHGRVIIHKGLDW